MDIQKSSAAGYEYAFIPGLAKAKYTLLLLHGTGGDELDLIPIGQQLLAEAHIISPRGNVLEHDHPRFFRRLSEGIFDEQDVIRRAGELSNFIGEIKTRYSLQDTAVIAVGYSNGANIAAAIMLLYPGSIQKAVLFRAMLPAHETKHGDPAHTSALLLNGIHDTVIARDKAESLAKVMREAGTLVDQQWLNAGHGLTQDDLVTAHHWLKTQTASKQSF